MGDHLMVGEEEVDLEDEVDEIVVVVGVVDLEDEGEVEEIVEVGVDEVVQIDIGKFFTNDNYIFIYFYIRNDSRFERRDHPYWY